MKRFAILLTIALMIIQLCAVFSVSVFADTYSGECGDNVTWKLDTGTGIFTASGTGDMYNFSYFNPSPWKDLSTSIKSVVIEDGVTSVGNWSFYGCYDLTSVSLPDGITKIGQYAFYYCENITELTIPSSVSEISAYAFCGMSALEEVTIPESVENVWDYSFQNCDSLEKIIFESADTAIYDSANTIIESATIYGYPGSTAEAYAEKYDREFVSLKKIKASGKCGNLDWVLYDDGLFVLSGQGAMVDYSYTPKSPWYRYKASIKNVVIEEGVTTIGSNAFEECSNLTSVSIPNGITKIGTSAFELCGSLDNVIVPDSVTAIGAGAFYKCESLKSIDLGDGIKEISAHAFNICTGLTEITLPESLELIGSYAFAESDNLESIVIPERVAELDGMAFNGCDSLEKITFLNPDIFFDDSLHDPKDAIPEKTVVYGYTGSTAQAYASEYNRVFISLDNTGEAQQGDLNNDGAITRDDAIYLLYHSIFGDEDYPLSQDCDYDNDGVITRDDAIYLLYHSIFGEESYPLAG